MEIPGPYSRVRLEELGLTLYVEGLEFWLEYRAARRRFYGGNRLERFFCRQVRPRLFPELEQLARSRWELARDRMGQDFLDAVVRAFERQGIEPVVIGGPGV